MPALDLDLEMVVEAGHVFERRVGLEELADRIRHARASVGVVRGWVMEPATSHPTVSGQTGASGRPT
ncbi:hypothetical protein Acsp06_27570 [Actinomycetospora sp. NBRC 106375]|nr:hypothetical protein Acsp06_27570 [Actinomycetospora sp. NBRC 106375]